MANSSPPPNAVPWIAHTTGLGQSSMRRNSACTRCERSIETSRFEIVPKTLISAPAMNVLPAPISTMALAAGSAAARATPASMPSGTPGLRAFTGGLFIVTMATSSWTMYWTSSGMVIRPIMAKSDAVTRRHGDAAALLRRGGDQLQFGGFPAAFPIVVP